MERAWSSRTAGFSGTVCRRSIAQTRNDGSRPIGYKRYMWDGMSLPTLLFLMFTVNECFCLLLQPAIGITNQRETTLVWDKHTGEPLYNAIVWGDTRTNKIVKQLKAKQGDDLDVQSISGLPIHNYFSAVKLHWLMHKVDAVRNAAKEKRAMFGTVDSWLIWVSLCVRVYLDALSHPQLMYIRTRTWQEAWMVVCMWLMSQMLHGPCLWTLRRESGTNDC